MPVSLVFRIQGSFCFLGTDGKWSDLQYNEFAPQRVGWKYDEWAIKAGTVKSYAQIQQRHL